MPNYLCQLSSFCYRALATFLLCAFLLAGCSSNGSNDPEDAPSDGDTTTDTGTNPDEETDGGSENSDTDPTDVDPTDVDPTETDPTAVDPTDIDPTDSEIPDNKPDPTPIVRAPSDTQAVVNEALSLVGSITFTTVPQGIPVIEWSKITGPGNAIFSDAQSASTTVTFDTAGTYQLRLRVTNGSYQADDMMQVVATDAVVNQAPTANAGPNESLRVDEVLNLSGQAEDDGLPNGTLSTLWNTVSGPGAITFGETSAQSTTATFSAVGEYVISFNADDGEVDASDNLIVTVTAAPVDENAGNVNAANTWENVVTGNGSKAQARHEAAATAFQGNMYLLGGRGIRQVNRYSPTNNRWENLGSAGFELSHFQPVVYGGKIYVLGSLECCFPSESVMAAIQIFDPATKTWSEGSNIPVNRRRGSAGTVVYNNKIYMIGGTTNGHSAGMVKWFDEYNPATDTWKTLPDAPTARDHFSAAMVGNKLVAAGGRQTAYPATFGNLVAAVDVYDFSSGQWSAGTNIPIPRAGAMTVSQGDEVILIGGEISGGVVKALDSVQAYNVKTNTWRNLDALELERHSGGAAIVGGAIHVVSGSTTTGGGDETQSHEKLNLD